MESAEAVAAKRRVLIDALMVCLGKSRVVEVVDARTVRGVIESASGELWRQGEFRLDPLWKILVAQPGLSAEDVAPPLLVFKAYEEELGVIVRTPQALSAIPRGEQVRLRDALGVRREDFQRAIAEIQSLAADQAAAEAHADVVRQAEAAAEDGARAVAKKKATDRRGLAIGLAIVAVIALGGSVWLAFRNTASAFDLADVAGTLQLAGGRSTGQSLSATITDPRWGTMTRAEREQAASAVFDIESTKGIKVLTLTDASGNTRAMVSESPDGRVVLLP
jgi:hypothetical protein